MHRVATTGYPGPDVIFAAKSSTISAGKDRGSSSDLADSRRRHGARSPIVLYSNAGKLEPFKDWLGLVLIVLSRW